MLVEKQARTLISEPISSLPQIRVIQEGESSRPPVGSTVGAPPVHEGLHAWKETRIENGLCLGGGTGGKPTANYTLSTHYRKKRAKRREQLDELM